MFKVIGCEFNIDGKSEVISVLDDTDDAVDKVTLAEALAYIAQGIEIEGIHQKDDGVSVSYTVEDALKEYDFVKGDNSYKLAALAEESKEEVKTEAKEENKVSHKGIPESKTVSSISISEDTKSKAKESKQAASKSVKNTEPKSIEIKSNKSGKSTSKTRVLNPMILAKLKAENVILTIKDTVENKVEEFDFTDMKRAKKSSILGDTQFSIDACSDDFLYFVGRDIKVSLPSTVVANFTVKDAMLFVVDSIVSFMDKDGKKSSLLDKCTGKGVYNIQVFKPFSEELGITGQRYEIKFTYAKS